MADFNWFAKQEKYSVKNQFQKLIKNQNCQKINLKKNWLLIVTSMKIDSKNLWKLIPEIDKNWKKNDSKKN